MKKEQALQYNKVLQKLMSLSVRMVKNKNGKWREKVTKKFLINTVKEFQKMKRKSNFYALAFSCLLNVKLILYLDKDPDWMNRTLKYIRKLEVLEDRNEELELKQKKYETLFSDVTVSILNYVSKVHNDIQEVSDEYKGIIDFDDDEMLNKVKEIQEKREQGLKEETDKDIIKRKKQENMDLLRDFSHNKLLMKEIEIENEKYMEKDRNMRENIQELKISLDATQHRFESRISEYKQQLHLKNELINNLKDQIQFQKKVISDQDQRMSIAETKEGKHIII